MTDTEIANLIMKHLRDANLGADMLFPNENVPVGQALPYIVAEFLPGRRTDDTLNGGFPVATGQVVFLVVGEQGNIKDPARVLADQIVALFPKATFMGDGPERVVITKPAEASRGYPDGKGWRVPVAVDYRTTT